MRLTSLVEGQGKFVRDSCESWTFRQPTVFLVSVSFASKSPHKGTWRFSVGISGGSLCVRASVGNATSVVTLLHDLQERLSGYPEVKALDCSIENFVFAVAFTRQKAVLSTEHSSATGDSEREKEREKWRTP